MENFRKFIHYTSIVLMLTLLMFLGLSLVGCIDSEAMVKNNLRQEPLEEKEVLWGFAVGLDYEIENSVVALKYIGEDFIANNKIYPYVNSGDIALDVSITNNEIIVTEIINVGTYILTATAEGYNLTNNQLTVVVEHAQVEASWKYYFENVDAAQVLGDQEEFEYSAISLNLICSYEFNGNTYIVDNNFEKNGTNVELIKDVGNYTIAAVPTDSNVLIVNNVKTLTISPKDVYVVANSYSVDYVGEIIENVGAKLYVSYDIDSNTGVELGFEDDIEFQTQYYKGTNPISIEEIIIERDSWVYSESDLVRQYFIEVTCNDNNYNVIDYIDGFLTINLNVLEISLFKDGVLQSNKTVHQAEIFDIANWLLSYGVIGEEITNWYIEEKEIVGEYKFSTSIELHSYSIYRLYYDLGTSENEIETFNTSEIKFHKYLDVSFPKLSDISETPYKYAYLFTGWDYNGDKKTYSQTFSTKNKDITSDIHLTPVFQAKEYNVYIQTWINDPSETIDNPIKSTKFKYTIEDFDNNKTYQFGAHEEIEGYQFLGWYYNDKKLQGDSFKISDLITRSMVDSGDLFIKQNYELFRCNVTMVVGDKTITSVNYEPGTKINKDYFYNLIDRKFGYIYIMSEVPEEANASVIIIRVTEVPFIWIMLGLLLLGGVIALIIIKSIKKHKNDIDKRKLDVILNRLGD